MRELKILTVLVYIGVAGVAVSLGGGIYTGVTKYREASQPRPSVFPTPAADTGVAPPPAAPAAVAPPAPGAMPTPAL
jgi:hypothetical protein